MFLRRSSHRCGRLRSEGAGGPSSFTGVSAAAQRLLRDEQGATAIEYGLIVAGISLVVIAAVSMAGSALWTILHNVSTAIAQRS